MTVFLYPATGGSSWKKIENELMAVDKSGWLYAIANDKKSLSVLQSKDKGKSWQSIADKVPVRVEQINDLAVSVNPGRKVYLATDKGLIVVKNEKWSWINPNSGLSEDDYGLNVISSVAVDPNTPDLIYAGRRSPGWGESNGIFMSSNGGETWENITHNLGPYLSVWAIKINPINSAVYIGTSLGTFRLEGDRTAKARTN